MLLFFFFLNKIYSIFFPKKYCGENWIMKPVSGFKSNCYMLINHLMVFKHFTLLKYLTQSVKMANLIAQRYSGVWNTKTRIHKNICTWEHFISVNTEHWDMLALQGWQFGIDASLTEINGIILRQNSWLRRTVFFILSFLKSAIQA